MRTEAKLRSAARLTEIQRVQRIGAEIALTAAKAAEEAARSEEAAARERSASALGAWETHLGKQNFSPEISGALSRHLIACERVADGALTEVHVAADVHARRESAWQRAEAQVRSGEATCRKLAREARRRKEAAALNRTADLTTYAWSIR